MYYFVTYANFMEVGFDSTHTKEVSMTSSASKNLRVDLRRWTFSFMLIKVWTSEFRSFFLSESRDTLAAVEVLLLFHNIATNVHEYILFFQ